MQCQLCLENRKLRRSHIIPDFFRDHSGTMYPTGKSDLPQPFTVLTHTESGNRFERKQHGYWEKNLGLIEYLLCCACELQLSKYEDYFKRYFYGGTDPIRFVLPLSDDPFFFADYAKIKLFLLSLLWRASVAKGKFWEAVNLPSRDLELIRFMLIHENPRRDFEYFCSMSRLVPSMELGKIFEANSISVETPNFAPTHRKFENFSTYTFVMGGLVLSFCLFTGDIPKILAHTYIKESGQFFLLQLEADSFFQQYSEKVIRSGNITYGDIIKDRSARERRPPQGLL